MAACILIPAYNAENTILAVVRECLGHGLPVMVVDDGSVDGTLSLLSDLPLTLLRHERNLGKGAALKTGFAWAIASGFDGVIRLMPTASMMYRRFLHLLLPRHRAAIGIS